MFNIAPWITRPVFISSTFKDMHAERDHLRQRVFPALEEKLRQRRHHLEAIDLRLGVETVALADEEAKELLVLKVCLDEIQRSRPFLIVLLGDRYGWVPPEERMAAAAREAGFDTAVTDKSVTALEIEFGILRKSPAQRRRAFFYFREALPYAGMPPEIAGQYSDRHSPDPVVRERHAQLEALKADLAADAELGRRVHVYRTGWDAASNQVIGLDDWGQMVFHHLWSELDDETAHYTAQPDSPWEALEHDTLAEFVEQRSRDFIGRDEIIGELLTLAHVAPEVDSWGVCVTGAAGTGKSSLFAQLVRKLQDDPSVLLLAHAAGISNRAGQIDDMLSRWAEELATHLNVANPIREQTASEDVDRAFAELLACAAAGRRVVMLVDALNQFEPSMRARHLSWLPRPWPANARFIATAIPGAESEGLTAQPGVRLMTLGPLPADEARQIAVAVGRRYHRAFHPHVLDAILTKRHDSAFAAGNPLWLCLAMEELNLLDADDFARADREFHGAPEQRLHQLLLDVASRLPADVAGLYRWMLQQTENVFGTPSARALADVIAVSRFGWRESDLRELVPRVASVLFPEAAAEAWDALKFAALRRGFRAHLVQRGRAEQWDFFHAQMRQAIGQRNLTDADLVCRLHACIADHLESLPADDPLRQTELMFHLIHAGDRLRTARHFGELSDSSFAFHAATEALATSIAARPGLAGEVGAWGDVAELTGEQQLEIALRLGTWVNEALKGRIANRERLVLLNGIGLIFERFFTGSQFNRYRNERYFAGWLKEMADLEMAEGRPDKAGNYLHRSLVLAQQAVADAANPSALRSDPAEWRRKLDEVTPDNADLSETQRRSYELGEEYMANALANLDRPSDGAEPADPDGMQRAMLEFSMAQAAKPKVFNDKLLVARRYHDSGTMVLAEGDVDAARQAFQKSLELAQEAEQHYRTRRDAQHHQFSAFLGLGDVAVAEQQPDEARTRYRQALELAEALIGEGVDERAGRHHLAVTHSRLATLDFKAGARDDAAAAFQRSLTLFRQLAAENPYDRNARSDLADGFYNLGRLEHAEGRLAQARTFLGESLALSQQLAADLPRDLQLQGALSRVIEDLGYLELATDQCDQARKYFEQRLGITRRLAAERPDDVATQRDVALALIALGDADRQDGQPAIAQERYDEGKSIILRLAGGLPDDVIDRDMAHLDERLASTRSDDPEPTTHADSREDRWRAAKRLVERGEQHLKDRNTHEAMRCFGETHALLSALAGSWSDNTSLQQDLAQCCDRLVLLSLSEQRWDDARAFSEQSMTVLERLAQLLPTDERRQVRHNYIQQGLLWLHAGRIDEARRLFGMELAISERLARAAPTDLCAQQEWAHALLEQGKLSMREGDWRGAQEWFAKGLAIRERLAQVQPNDFQTLREWTEAVARLEHATEGDGEVDVSCRNRLVKCDRLAQEAPRELLNQRGLLQSLALVGQGCFWAGALPEARRLFLLFAAIIDRLDRSMPDFPEVHQEWSAILSRLAAIALLEGKGEEARRFLVQWLKLCEMWAARASNAEAAASQWPAALDAVNVLRDLPNTQTQADRMHGMQVRVSEILVLATPDNAHAARELAFHLQLLAASQTLAHEARVAALLDAIGQCEQLHEKRPVDTVTGHALAQACYQLGTLYRDTGQEEMALTYLDRCRAVLRELQENGITLEPQLEAAAIEAPALAAASPSDTAPNEPIVGFFHFLGACCLIALGITISLLWSWAWLAGVPIAIIGCLMLAIFTVFRTDVVRIYPCPRCGADALQFRGRIIRCSKCQ